MVCACRCPFFVSSLFFLPRPRGLFLVGLWWPCPVGFPELLHLPPRRWRAARSAPVQALWCFRWARRHPCVLPGRWCGGWTGSPLGHVPPRVSPAGGGGGWTGPSYCASTAPAGARWAFCVGSSAMVLAVSSTTPLRLAGQVVWGMDRLPLGSCAPPGLAGRGRRRVGRPLL